MADKEPTVIFTAPENGTIDSHNFTKSGCLEIHFTGESGDKRTYSIDLVKAMANPPPEEYDG